ncbi:Microcystin-dependent protein [Dyadobacter soli]|uniref:Microcystin-dependent protein n=1 Tax=Dyadobacter soli TaxID=659014 RepID=A0A1G7VYT4_9BACT|nr:tail fiber protein [Dyadobacter soli]SDG64050.1 Microcystin-dependent protein [Dyadobacter soli]
MDYYYIGEIRIFAADFAPAGWLACAGQILPIERFAALHSLIGNAYGGDGKTTFALPDLRSRIPLGQSDRNPVGTKGGFETITLKAENLPPHRHVPACSNTDNSNSIDGTNGFWSGSTQHGTRYGQAPGATKMSTGSILPEGGSEPHENRMPMLALTYAIAVDGPFPSRGPGGYGLSFPAEIRMFGFPIEIQGYVPCDGRSYPVNSEDQLFRLIGATFGKEDGRYKLPDLRDRVLIGNGAAYPDFSPGGEESHKLTLDEMPRHRHKAVVSSGGSDSPTPEDHFWPADAGYVTQNNSFMSDQALEATGKEVAHDNMSPYLAINYTICTDGMFTDGSFPPIEEYLGTVRAFAAKVIPQYWLPCDGRELPIASNTALYSLLGTKYGGNGTTTFALPDLRGRAVIQYWPFDKFELTTYKIGEKAGTDKVTLKLDQMPSHTHAPLASKKATTQRPEGQVWANEDSRPPINRFAATSGTAHAMHPSALGEAGADQPHNNMMPYLGIEFMICCNGIFPSRG